MHSSQMATSGGTRVERVPAPRELTMRNGGPPTPGSAAASDLCDVDLLDRPQAGARRPTSRSTKRSRTAGSPLNLDEDPGCVVAHEAGEPELGGQAEHEGAEAHPLDHASHLDPSSSCRWSDHRHPSTPRRAICFPPEAAAPGQPRQLAGPRRGRARWHVTHVERRPPAVLRQGASEPLSTDAEVAQQRTLTPARPRGARGLSRHHERWSCVLSRSEAKHEGTWTEVPETRVETCSDRMRRGSPGARSAMRSPSPRRSLDPIGALIGPARSPIVTVPAPRRHLDVEARGPCDQHQRGPLDLGNRHLIVEDVEQDSRIEVDRCHGRRPKARKRDAVEPTRPHRQVVAP